MYWSRPLLISILLAATCVPAAMAGTAGDEAGLLVKQLGERTIAAVKLEGKPERRLQLIAAGALVMDYRTIGKSVLAYAGAKVSTGREVEVNEAVILFVSHQIISKIESVRPEKAEITKVDEKSPDMVVVDMALAGMQDTITAVWTVKRVADAWLITDISVSGVSLSMHFGQILARYAGNIDELMKYLVANSPLKRENLTLAQ
jgi:ABC-type transporter MlaC component